MTTWASLGNATCGELGQADFARAFPLLRSRDGPEGEWRTPPPAGCLVLRRSAPECQCSELRHRLRAARWRMGAADLLGQLAPETRPLVLGPGKLQRCHSNETLRG